MTNKSAEWMSQCAYGPQPRPPHFVLSSHSLGGCAPRSPCLGEGLLLGGHAGTLSHVTLGLLSQCQVLLPLRVGVKRGHTPKVSGGQAGGPTFHPEGRGCGLATC